MPEGPSIIILKEAAQIFAGKTIIEVSGNSKIDQTRTKSSNAVFRSGIWLPITLYSRF